MGALVGSLFHLLLSLSCLLATDVLLHTQSASLTAYLNTKVFTPTALDTGSYASALITNGTLIVFVGTTAAAETYLSTVTKTTPVTVYDLQGKEYVVLPGVQDSHLHPVEAGVNSDNCVFSRTFSSRTLFAEELRTCAEVFIDAPWILGSGIGIESVLAGMALPNDDGLNNSLQFLDSLESVKPVLLLDDLGHGVWVNTPAIVAAGLEGILVPGASVSTDAAGAGGIVHLDANTGEVTGIFFENAQQRLRDAAYSGDANRAYFKNKLKATLATLASNGITSVSDAGGFWSRFGDAAWIDVEEEVSPADFISTSSSSSASALGIRASNALYLYPDKPFDTQLAELKSKYRDETTHPSSMVWFNHIKIYIDGILTLGTAAMNSPYTSPPGVATNSTNGMLYFADSQLLRNYTSALVAHGFQLHFHAVGDRAVRIALDEIAAVQGLGGNNKPHRITHLYQIATEDRALFKSRGVYADFQLAPSSQSSDYVADMTSLLGSERTQQLQPFEAMVASGANVILSSDWDADKLSPFIKLQTVFARLDAAGLLESTISREKVVDMMTRVPAQVLSSSSSSPITGTIEVGKRADVIVLDTDIFTVSSFEKVGNAKVLRTVSDGRVVYDHLGTSNAGRLSVAGSWVKTPGAKLCTYLTPLRIPGTGIEAKDNACM
eukprot:Nk52_evm147s226 gene=Nk52_evmTU147s226